MEDNNLKELVRKMRMGEQYDPSEGAAVREKIRTNPELFNLQERVDLGVKTTASDMLGDIPKDDLYIIKKMIGGDLGSSTVQGSQADWKSQYSIALDALQDALNRGANPDHINFYRRQLENRNFAEENRGAVERGSLLQDAPIYMEKDIMKIPQPIKRFEMQENRYIEPNEPTEQVLDRARMKLWRSGRNT